MRLSGRVLSACLAFVVFVPAIAAAGGLYEPAVGPSASGMGGAFIGLADDYSAVHWNPAGIVQIQGTTATVSVQDLLLLGSRDGTVLYEDFANVPDKYETQEVAATSVTENLLGAGLFAYANGGPLRALFDKVGIAAYTLADYGAKWDGEDLTDAPLTNPQGLGYDSEFWIGDTPDLMSRVRAYSISPVAAKQITSKFSIGVSGHAVYAKFELKDGGFVLEGEEIPDPPEPPDLPPTYELDLHPYQRTEEATGWGYGATVGILFQATDQINVGASVRTPITVTFEGDVEVVSTFESYQTASQTEEFDFTFPMWAGLGIAYQDFLFEGTVLTLDGQWTQWSEVDEIVRVVETELPNGLGTTALGWEDTIEFAVGIDHRLSRSTSLRLGYRAVPSPVPDDTFNFVMPMSQKSVFSIGVGYRSDVWTLDASLAYHAGEKRELSGGDMDGKHLDDIMVPSLSFTYGF